MEQGQVMYRGAKEGQIVFYSRNPWEEREAVEFVRYYKDTPSLTHPNAAIIRDGGIAIHVDIKNIYRKGN